MDTGGQAFPGYAWSGMFLRDWLAGQALAGLATQSNELLGVVNKTHPDWSAERMRSVVRECVALAAYEYADAMIAERAK